MSLCTLTENVVGGCPRCEAELKRLKAIEAAAHRTVALLTHQPPVAVPPAVLLDLYALAAKELKAALDVEDPALD